MKTLQWCFGLCIVLLVNSPVWAQQSQAVAELEAAFRQFQFQEVLTKGRYFLGEPGLSRQDSLTIYEYMLNAAYALNDTVQAKAIIDEILRTDPNFQPDPRITSPKIMEFYRWYRKNRQPLFPPKPSQPQPQEAGASPQPIAVPWWQVGATVLFPGSVEWWRQKNPANTLRLGITVALLGSMVYTIGETARREEAYLSATQDFDYYYDRYNRMYRLRSVAIAAYAGWVVWHLYRLVHQPTMKPVKTMRWQIQMMPMVKAHAPGGYLRIAWQL